jgi:oxygen-independent coproporphyrinogen-3 oxidase
MTASYAFDADIVRKYDIPGPRYTSYPPAPQFSGEFTEQTLRDHIRRSNAEPIPRRLSLYLHIPYCFSPCFYCGCNRVITRDRTKGRHYMERLVREIEAVGALFDRDREVVQLHMGGGTPNFLRPDELQEILESIDSHFRVSLSDTRDFSIEIDPRFIDPADIAAYAHLGFNRASLGVQDFDPEVQRAVNRVQSVEQTLAVIDACRLRRFRSVNVDLIYGLPMQTLAGFERTLDIVLKVRPDRLAIYSYAHLPELFKAQRQIDPSTLPTPETKLELLSLAIERLSAAGYEYIGMDHFALPEDPLALAQANGTLHRNFMGYTTHADCDLVGLGVSAIGHIGDCYSQNARDLPTWEASLDCGRLPVWRGLELDFDDLLRSELIEQLMCFGRIDIASLERRYEIDFQSYFAGELQQLQPLIDDGLAIADNRTICATSRGRLLLRIIAMCFDRYLHSAPPGVSRYSRAI